ncbi:hypothetical protein [Actinoplanes sp. NPDC023714]|uniref:hypothetical protein n=1 Tax=Actinoplanes sp. NPDC023714 TaxID=3154322 RepID=UPI0033E0544C
MRTPEDFDAFSAAFGIRAHGRHRRSRRRAAAAGSAAALIVAVAAGSVLLSRPERTTPVGAAPSGDPAPACAVPADTEIPASTGEVKVRVLAGAGGEALARDLRGRGFDAAAGEPSTARPAREVATIHVGPAAAGRGTLINAYLLAQATIVVDPTRTDDVVDLAIGPRFQQFATPTEVNQALAHLTSVEVPYAC